jgi:type I site-specific restriction endonuclease
MRAWPKSATAALLLLFPVHAVSQKKIAKLEKKVQQLERKYSQQKKPVDRAKVFAKLLPKGIEEATVEIQRGAVDRGIERIEKLRAEAHKVHDALIVAVDNPVRHSNGFVQMQVALRESIRELRDTLDIVPFRRRDAVAAARADFQLINNELLQELFPPPPPPKRRKKKHTMTGGLP